MILSIFFLFSWLGKREASANKFVNIDSFYNKNDILKKIRFMPHAYCVIFWFWKHSILNRGVPLDKTLGNERLQ